MTKNIHTVPSYAEPRGWGLGPEAEGTQLLSVAPRYFTEWYTTRGTEFGRWGASVRAHVLACEGVGVRACVRARDSGCYNIRFSLSPILQLLIFRQALDFALLKD